MNIRRHITRVAALTAAATSLGLTLATPAAHADSCESQPFREFHVSDVSVKEGNPSPWTTWKYLTFTVETFGCLDASTVWFAVHPAPSYMNQDSAEYNDVVQSNPQAAAFVQGQLSWGQGDASTKTVRIQVVMDKTPEGHEAVSLFLGKVSGSFKDPNPIGPEATGWILDDDTIIN